MVQFGGRFIPVHFVGALVGRRLPATAWNVELPGAASATAGQRHQPRRRRRRQQRASGVGGQPLRETRRPAFGLQVGGSVVSRSRHRRRAARSSTSGSPRRTSRGSAKTRRSSPKSPTCIISRSAAPLAASNLAYYVQTAYRLPVVDRTGSRTTGSSTSTSTRRIWCLPACRIWMVRRIGVRYDISTVRRDQDRGSRAAARRRSAAHQRRLPADLFHILNGPWHELTASPRTRDRIDCCSSCGCSLPWAVGGSTRRRSMQQTNDVTNDVAVVVNPDIPIDNLDARRAPAADARRSRVLAGQRARRAPHPCARCARARRHLEGRVPDDRSAVPPALDRESASGRIRR